MSLDADDPAHPKSASSDAHAAEPEPSAIVRVAREFYIQLRRSPADTVREFLGETIWQWELDGMSRTQKTITQALRLLYLVGRGFVSARAQQQAMALTYTTMLALVPAFAIMVALFSVRGLETAKGKVQTFVIDAISASPETANVLAQWLDGLVANLQGGGVAGFAFFVFLFITIVALLSNLEKTLNDIWDVKRPRSFINKFVTYWCIATLGPICLGAALVQGSTLQTRLDEFASSARQAGSELIGSKQADPGDEKEAGPKGDDARVAFMFGGVGGALADQWELSLLEKESGTEGSKRAGQLDLDRILGGTRSADTESVLAGMLSLGLTIVTFTLLYVFLPNTRVKLKPALLGAIGAALLWAGTRWALASTSATLVRYNTVYGSLATIPITMVWLYLTWLIVILGAELTFALQNLTTQRKEELADETTELFKETVALRICAAVARAFENGWDPPDLEGLGELTGAPHNLCADLLFHLTQDGLTREIELGHDLRGYVPGRPLDRISISDVVDSLRERKGISFELAGGEDLHVVQRHLDQANAASKALASRITLRQVAQSLNAGSGAVDSDVSPETAAATAAAMGAIQRLSATSILAAAEDAIHGEETAPSTPGHDDPHWPEPEPKQQQPAEPSQPPEADEDA